MNKKYIKTYKQTAFRFSPETEKKLLELTLVESVKKKKQVYLVDIIRKLIDKAHRKITN